MELTGWSALQQCVSERIINRRALAHEKRPFKHGTIRKCKPLNDDSGKKLLAAVGRWESIRHGDPHGDEEGSSTALADMAVKAGDTTTGEAEKREMKEVVRWAVAKMKRTGKVLILFYGLDGDPISERKIAALMGVSRARVHQLHTRGKVVIKELLEQYR